MAKKIKPRTVSLDSLYYQRTKLLAAIEASEAMQAAMSSQPDDYEDSVFVDWEVWSRMYALLDNEMYLALKDIDREISKHRITR